MIVNQGWPKHQKSRHGLKSIAPAEFFTNESSDNVSEQSVTAKQSVTLGLAEKHYLSRTFYCKFILTGFLTQSSGLSQPLEKLML